MTKNLNIGWTGVNSSGDCILCKEPDKPTKEWETLNMAVRKTFFACDECLEGK